VAHADHEDTLLRLAIREDAYVDAVLASEAANLAASHQDAKTHALVRLAALVSVDATTPSYLASVDAARGSGATDEEIVGTLVALIPVVGVARVVSAAPKLGLALGFDLTSALEDIDGAAVLL
jgi:alkylhydroperoxidase/carboxymuconolactone decarboxylase family protein YurZ